MKPCATTTTPRTTVLVYVLNGLANMATANKSLSDFVGRHGACQAVVSALEQHPRDLQLQASGVKAVRALALGGGRNVEVLADVRGPVAIARAQGLFLRDREVQLACLGAAETLCRGGNRANREALVDAGSVNLLENALIQFASDAEVVSQGLRALVEIVLSGASTAAADGPYAETKVVVVPTEDDDAGKKKKKRRHENNAEVEESSSVRSSSLPQLKRLVGNDTATAAPKPPRLPGEDSGAAVVVVVAEVSRAVGTVLAILERDPCRDVCLSAFDALSRLLVNLGTADLDSVDVGADIMPADQSGQGSSSDGLNNNSGCCASSVGGLLRLAKVRYVVKRALKINRSDDVLASRGGKILTLIAVARGRALAQ